MNSKMTTKSQLSTTEPKNQPTNKQKLSQQLEQEENHRNGDHLEGYQRGGGRGREGGKGTGNKKHKWSVRNRQGEVKNSLGNVEAKELICTTHGHELKRGGGNVGGRGYAGWRGIRGGNGTTVIA